MTPKNNILIGVIVALLVIASYNVDANPIEFVEGLPNLAIILEEIVEVEPKYIPTALWAMFETIQMAFIGTVIGIVIAFLLVCLQQETLTVNLSMHQFEHYLLQFVHFLQFYGLCYL